jgi:integrase
MLTVRQINALTPGDRIHLGDNLSLAMKPNRKCKWIFRYTRPKGVVVKNCRSKKNNRMNETTIGPYPAFSYSEARAEAVRLRGLVAKGIDPVAQKREQRAAQTTFGEVADGWIENNQGSWSDSMKRNVNLRIKTHGKVLLNKAISSIDTDTVEAAIKPLWAKAPKQARGTLRIWAKVFGYAKQKKLISDNPAAWKDNLEHVFPKLSKKDKKNFASMPYAELPDFVRRLRIRQSRGVSAACLEFCILTATRSGETMGAQWSEFDLENKTWSIPAERMKVKGAHRVPLNERCMEILSRQREYRTSEYVFSGYNRAQLDEKAMRVLLRTMGVRVTVHGFRATFKSWATEQTDYAWELIELCLSHKVGTVVARAYLRGDALEKRRPLMEEWALYCAGR